MNYDTQQQQFKYLVKETIGARGNLLHNTTHILYRSSALRGELTVRKKRSERELGKAIFYFPHNRYQMKQ
jgi:hypothetical protein